MRVPRCQATLLRLGPRLEKPPRFPTEPIKKPFRTRRSGLAESFQNTVFAIHGLDSYAVDFGKL